MSKPDFPDGRDEDKIRRVLSRYEEQTDDDALAEDEAGFQSSETVMGNSNTERD